ncbi:MAG: HAMP domain-containing sensor histidine kinase [Myxococcales bacterium]
MTRSECARCLLLSEGMPAPVAFCSGDGSLQSATPPALALLARVLGDHEPLQLPGELWRLLEQTATGDYVAWSPEREAQSHLGCTRYAVEGGGYMLLLREIAGHPVSALPAHQPRLESTHRLVASVAHELRSSVASIVYSADFLDSSGRSMVYESLRETVKDICDASRRLQLTLDGLLDYARLGPPISVPVSLFEVVNRAQSLLNSLYRDGLHRVRIELHPESAWVRGNPIVIEQIFVNLLLHSAERAAVPCQVTISSSLSSSHPGSHLYLRVCDDGPALSSRAWDGLLEATAPRELLSSQIALAEARAAAENQGGRLLLEADPRGSAFAVFLPRSDGPR